MPNAGPLYADTRKWVEMALTRRRNQNVLLPVNLFIGVLKEGEFYHLRVKVMMPSDAFGANGGKSAHLDPSNYTEITLNLEIIFFPNYTQSA